MSAQGQRSGVRRKESAMCRLKFSYDIGNPEESCSALEYSEKKYREQSMYSCRKCLSEIGRLAPRPKTLVTYYTVLRTVVSFVHRRMQIPRRTVRPTRRDATQRSRPQLARCYCNAIQSHVTTRLVVWLHNPICQAIGHRRVAVRVIPAGCRRRFLALPLRRGSESQDLETRRFSGSWHRLWSRGPSRDDPT